MSAKFLLTVFAAAVALFSGAQAQTIAVMNGRVLTAGGAGLIEGGDVIIRNGVISAVGEDLQPPQGAQVIDASGKVVTPGLIAPFSTIGLKEISLDREGNDAGPREGYPLSAALDALDAYNPASTLLDVNRAGGITRALSAPEPGDKLFGGQAAVIDLSGTAQSVTKPRAAQIAVLGYSGAARSGDTRMGAMATMREYLDQALSYAADPRDYVRRQRAERFSISDLKALGPVVAGDQPLIVSAYRAADIRNVIRLKNEYRLKVILLGGSEAWEVAGDLAAADIPVILDPLANLPSGFEDMGATLKNAARLHGAGVKIAFYNPPGFGAHNLRALPQLAGNAVAAGLPYDAAIAALTINPAEMFGLGDRLGSIEVGKVADLVVWSGDPLELSSAPDAVLIAGRETSLENRQTRLRDRYKNLSRGDLPHAYRGEN
ncbi:MAG: amidohydrolase family protein [Parvularculaceae bacterium]